VFQVCVFYWFSEWIYYHKKRDGISLVMGEYNIYCSYDARSLQRRSSSSILLRVPQLIGEMLLSLFHYLIGNVVIASV